MKLEKIRAQTKIRQRKLRAHQRGYAWDPVNCVEIRPESDYRKKGRKSEAYKVAMRMKQASCSKEQDEECSLPDIGLLDAMVHAIDKGYGTLKRKELLVQLEARDATLQSKVQGETCVLNINPKNINVRSSVTLPRHTIVHAESICRCVLGRSACREGEAVTGGAQSGARNV